MTFSGSKTKADKKRKKDANTQKTINNRENEEH